MTSLLDSPSSRTRIMRTRSMFLGTNSLQAASGSTVTVTQQATSTSNQYNNSGNSTLNKLSTIMPGFLIALFCFVAVFMACGLIHARRRRRQRALDRSVADAASEDSERPKKQKKKPEKPVLWEVDVKNVCWEKDLEALHPVAVELQAGPWPHRKPENAEREPEKRSHWLAPILPRSLGKSQQAANSTQQAQVTFMVSMPAPDRPSNQSSREIALGTTLVSYQDDESDDEDVSAELVDRHGFTYAY